MPRFELVVRWSTPRGRSAALGALARRYPEIELVESSPGEPGTERWTCEAPGIAHVERWLLEQTVDATIVDRQGPTR